MLDEFIKFCTKKEDGWCAKIKVVANSKQNSIEFFENYSEKDYQIKIKVSKPALGGKANEEIIKYLSKILNLAKNNISILKGEKSTIKTLFITKDSKNI